MGRGRPTKFTEEARENFLAAVREGAYYNEACALVRIDYRTFRYWMEKGEAAKSGEFFHFFHAVREAAAYGEFEAIHSWRQHLQTDWRASRDYLRYRHPERWNPVQNIELSGSEKKEPVQINFNIERTTGADITD